jgi:hypothetical protein
LPDHRIHIPVLVLMALASGCNPPVPPPPKPALPPVPAIMRFADDTAKALAQEIPELPAIHEQERKGTLELGAVQNDAAMPQGDFDMLESRLITDVMHSDAIKAVLVPIEDKGDMAKEFTRSQGDPVQDPLQEGKGGSNEPDKYDPATTFILRGQVFKSQRGDQFYFYLNIKLVNLKSRKVIYDNDFMVAPT